MNEMTVFQNPDFGNLTVIYENDKAYFPATECAKMLGYTNPRKAVSDHCPHVTKRDVGVQTGVKADGTPAMQTVQRAYIPEGDLYRLIIRSKLPSAERFEKWVFDEVLPTIRKTGHYSTRPDTITIDIDTLKTIVGATVEETLKRVMPLIRPEPVAQEVSVKRLRKRNPVIPVNFSGVLNRVIEERKMSGRQIAQRLGVNESTVSTWRSGTNRPNSKNLIQFSLQFNIPMAELAEGIF